MRRERLRALLEDLHRGEVGVEEVLRRLGGDALDVPGVARIDQGRALRVGQPEAILCAGKDVEDVLSICRSLAAAGTGFLVTRASQTQLDRLAVEFPLLETHRRGRIAYLPPDEVHHPRVLGQVLIVTGGTADLPIAVEARVTARALGNPTRLHVDVGVAGLHRILDLQAELREASVIIVIAGMDGALASVVGGLVASPVIAVPTSVGYGATLGGTAALLAMLSSCAPGITVVNVDNGYGAACAATRINQPDACNATGSLAEGGV